MSPLFFVLLAQVGAAPSVGVSPHETPPEVRERRRVAQPPAPATAAAAPLGRGGCIAEIEADPARGVEAAEAQALLAGLTPVLAAATKAEDL